MTEPPSEPAESLAPGLYLIATPIGNREDLSPRALNTLLRADLIACEDTRHVQRLLTGKSPAGAFISYHDHNEAARADQLVEAVRAGKAIALVSDAGTPTISDPGFRVVRAFRAAGLPVTGIPGPCAAILALSISGLPSDKFCFLGFAPPKTHGRCKILREYAEADLTLIFYESVHRIEKLLQDVVDTLGPERTIAVARELTKQHEIVFAGRAEEVFAGVLSDVRKGEYVVLIAKSGFSLQ